MHTENRIRDAFQYIEAGQDLKSSTLAFLKNARQADAGRLELQETPSRMTPRRRPRRLLPCVPRSALKLALGAICALFVLLVGTGGYTMLYVPVSYVSIDVNPSIELSLNRLDRVICATAYNEDGASILDDISVGGKYYTDAIDLLMDSPAMLNYLTEDAAPTFTVAASSSKAEQMLLLGVQGTRGCSGHGGTSYITDIHTIEDAHAYGLSLGKYAAYRILSQYDASVTTQDCQHMSMSEIHNRIAEHEHNGQEHHGHGAGSDAGHGHHGSSQ